MRKRGYLLLILLVPILSMAQTRRRAPVKKPTNYSVTINCNVPEAALYVDGEHKGTVGDVKSLKKGQHILNIIANGYYEVVDTINVVADSNSYSYELEAETYELTLYDILFTPLGIPNVSVGYADPEIIKANIASQYLVEDDNQSDRTKFGVYMCHNTPKKVFYHGNELASYSFEDIHNDQPERSISYLFDISKEHFPDINSMYSLLDEIIAEFKTLGYKGNYKKIDNGFDTASGWIDLANNISCHLSITDVLSSYTLNFITYFKKTDVNKYIETQTAAKQVTERQNQQRAQQRGAAAAAFGFRIGQALGKAIGGSALQNNNSTRNRRSNSGGLNIDNSSVGGVKAKDLPHVSDDSDSSSSNSRSSSSSSSSSSKSCRLCVGRGYCKTCTGTGVMTGFTLNDKLKCSTCNGTGKCPSCHGTGKQ